MKHFRAAAALLVLACASMSTDFALAAGKLAIIFKFDMLSVRPSYLESITGPAKEIATDRSGAEVRSYRIDGCDVRVFFEKDVARRYSLSLSRKCNFNLGAFLPGYASTSGLTVQKLVDGPQHPELRFRADCIYSCGNAADPTVDFMWEGPHSVNFIYVALTVTLADDLAIAASGPLKDLMLKNEGEDYVLRTKFNCDGKYDQIAARNFAKVPVNEIVIGFAGKDRQCPQ